MSDSGKINIKNDFVKPGLPKSESGAAPSEAAKPSNLGKPDADIYKGSTKSQSKLLVDKEGNLIKANNKNVANKELGSKLDVEIRHKNPILFEQLKKADAKLADNPRPKQAPPDPSLRVKLSPKGYPINPRKVKPEIPGRLNPFFDNGMSAMDRLAMSLGEQTSVDLNNLYSDNALMDYMKNYQSSSIAELLNLEHTIFNQGVDFAVDFLAARAELLSEDQFLYDFLQNILNILQNTQNPIQQILQLYLPFPLPFLVRDIDEEFEKDEEELRDEAKENQSDEEQGDESEDEEHDEISLSVTTLNFNKIHFLVRFLKSSNAAKVFIKGDASSSEVSIPVEMAVDDALYGEVEHFDFNYSLWRKAIPLEVSQRFLKVKHNGKLDSKMISVTRAILETIADNDYNDEDASSML